MADSNTAGDPSKRVPVLRTENSLIHDEFNSLRSRFDEEMRQMEAEMARFRNQMVSSFSKHHSSMAREAMKSESSSRKIISSLKTTSTSTSTSTKSLSSTGGQNFAPLAPGGVECTESVTNERQVAAQASSPEPTEVNPLGAHWIDNFVNSPLIVDSAQGGGEKLLKLRFDVSAYEPDKIVVKTADSRLQVHAEREERSENKSTFSEYNREFLLPSGVDPESITSTLSADGVLTVEAPLPPRNC